MLPDKAKAILAFATGGSGLDWLPTVTSFFYIWGLKTGAITAGILGIIHPALITIYVNRDSTEKVVAKIGGILSGSYFVASVVLLVGTLTENSNACLFYEYFIIVFIVISWFLIIWTIIHMIRLRDFNVSMVPCAALPIVFFSLLVYFVVVVNSYRKARCS